MEILKRIINKYMPLSLGSMMAFVMMVNIMSCESCKRDPDETNSKLQIVPNKTNFRGMEDRDINVVVKLADEDIEKTAVLDNYKIKAVVKAIGGVGGIKFTYYDVGGAGNKTTIQGDTSGREEIQIHPLSYFFELGSTNSLVNGESLETKLTFVPTDATGIELKLYIVDADGKDIVDADGNDVSPECVINWHADAKTVKMEFTKPEDDQQNFIAGNPYTFELTNKGEDVERSKLTVKLIATDGIEFTLGGQAVDGITGQTLDKILGDVDQAITDTGSEKFDLKLHDAKGKSTAKVTIIVEYKGKEIASRSIAWKAKHVELAFTDADAFFTGDNEHEFVLKNNGEEVNSDELIVTLTADKGVQYTLGGQDATGGVKLSAIRDGGQGNLAKDVESKFKIKRTADVTTEKSSTVTIKVEHAASGFTISRAIEWKAKHVELAFTTPGDDGQRFTANNVYTFELKNNGEEVKRSELTVKLTTTDGVEFTLGGKTDVDAVGKTLEHILGVDQAITDTGSEKFDLKLHDAKGKSTAKVTIIVEYKGKEIASRSITWKAKHVELAFTDADAFFTGDNEHEFVLRNNGEEVDSDELIVTLTADKGVQYTLSGQDATGGAKLSAIRDGGQGNLAKDVESKFKIKRTADVTTEKSSTVTIKVEHAASGFKISKDIVWKAKHVELAFTIPGDDGQRFTANNVYTFELKNNGEEVKRSELTVKLTTTDGVEFTLGGKTDVDAVGKTLEHILGVDQAITNTGSEKFDLQLHDAKGKTSSEITIVVAYDGKEVARRIINWSV